MRARSGTTPSPTRPMRAGACCGPGAGDGGQQRRCSGTALGCGGSWCEFSREAPYNDADERDPKDYSQPPEYAPADIPRVLLLPPAHPGSEARSNKERGGDAYEHLRLSHSFLVSAALTAAVA